MEAEKGNKTKGQAAKKENSFLARRLVQIWPGFEEKTKSALSFAYQQTPASRGSLHLGYPQGLGPVVTSKTHDLLNGAVAVEAHSPLMAAPAVGRAWGLGESVSLRTGSPHAGSTGQCVLCLRWGLSTSSACRRHVTLPDTSATL